MEKSTDENVTNNEIASIHKYVNEVKRDKEVGIQYMKSWEYEQMIREESRKEGIEAGIEAGQKRINALNCKLAEAGRYDDIIHASSDTEYQKKQLKEFDL